MNNFYIYKFEYKETNNGVAKTVSASVIFCDKQEINENNLIEEIGKFYEMHYQTDKIFVIGTELLKDRLNEVFIKNQDKTFSRIPKRQETFLADSIYILTFDRDGIISCDNKVIPKGFELFYLTEGLQNIFKKRGKIQP